MIEVLTPGTLTTVQEWPGRTGLWEVGVPPSGPMDDRSLRIANRLVGNREEAAGLEMTLAGAALRFGTAATVAITGAPAVVTLDGDPVASWAPLEIPAGAELRVGTVREAGLRTYLAVRGGLAGTPALGSRATFAPGGIGGRPLAAGDVLAVCHVELGAPPPCGPAEPPELGDATVLRVVLGPHGAPDLLRDDGLAALLGATWTVHHHSDRTGVRLVGPVPGWARSDGGEAGLHPSNILDSAYGVGTIMLAGDMAVVVGPDGPSLGGFVAFAQVAAADLWRLGQVRAGDRVTLAPVDAHEAARLRAAAAAEIAGARRPAPEPSPRSGAPCSPVLDVPVETAAGPVTLRRAGERALLVEFGDPVLDLRSRVRVHHLQEALRATALGGVSDLTPGVRSLHVQHDPDRLPTSVLAAAVARIAGELPAPEDAPVPGRIVHLPLAWRESEAMRAVERYMSSVRADAPWCPDNIEFIRRMNGLDAEEDVRRIVFDASYLVLGLGDVYLGAPVAVPLDPRHRLVTTKYNPARTWTPPNAVGIGGAFLCIYGMEGPGGYQLVGRTVPIWDDREAPAWRLRHFDQLRFHPVGEEELYALRRASAAGEWAPATEPAAFDLSTHAAFLRREAASIAAFRTRREAAFEAERRAWEAAALGEAA